MHLTPKLPPGRANRKALAYSADIQRLRSSGYSFEAIRQLLLEAGLEVSRTTLKREAARPPARALPGQQREERPPKQPTEAPLPSHDRQEPTERQRAPKSFVGDTRTGKEIVDAFMEGRITNPLMQERTEQ